MVVAIVVARVASGRGGGRWRVVVTVAVAGGVFVWRQFATFGV